MSDKNATYYKNLAEGIFQAAQIELKKPAPDGAKQIAKAAFLMSEAVYYSLKSLNQRIDKIEEEIVGSTIRDDYVRIPPKSRRMVNLEIKEVKKGEPFVPEDLIDEDQETNEKIE